MIVNKTATIQIVKPSDVPVLLIDNFYEDPQEVRAQALKATYDHSLGQYPGRHASIDPSSIGTVLDVLSQILNRVGDRHFRAEDFTSDFSIITTRPDELLVTQKHPHIDPTPVIGVLYLTPNSDEGTSLYRNEYIGTAVVQTPEHHRKHSEFMNIFGESASPNGYLVEDDAMWKKIYTIEPIFNRLAIYPGNAFHSVDIKRVAARINMDTVRVTQRFIIKNCFEKA